mgnify:CR=1 FL=1
MSKLDKDQVIEQFTQAYTSANGKAPTIEAKGGWYSVDGGKNVRLATLAEMTSELSDTKSTAPKVEKAPVKKPATTKKSAKKSPKAAKTSGFSVKDWWQENVLNATPGNRPPR